MAEITVPYTRVQSSQQPQITGDGTLMPFMNTQMTISNDLKGVERAITAQTMASTILSRQLIDIGKSQLRETQKQTALIRDLKQSLTSQGNTQRGAIHSSPGVIGNELVPRSFNQLSVGSLMRQPMGQSQLIGGQGQYELHVESIKLIEQQLSILKKIEQNTACIPDKLCNRKNFCCGEESSGFGFGFGGVDGPDKDKDKNKDKKSKTPKGNRGGSGWFRNALSGLGSFATSKLGVGLSTAAVGTGALLYSGNTVTNDEEFEQMLRYEWDPKTNTHRERTPQEIEALRQQYISSGNNWGSQPISQKPKSSNIYTDISPTTDTAKRVSFEIDRRTGYGRGFPTFRPIKKQVQTEESLQGESAQTFPYVSHDPIVVSSKKEEAETTSPITTQPIDKSLIPKLPSESFTYPGIITTESTTAKREIPVVPVEEKSFFEKMTDGFDDLNNNLEKIQGPPPMSQESVDGSAKVIEENTSVVGDTRSTLEKVNDTITELNGNLKKIDEVSSSTAKAATAEEEKSNKAEKIDSAMRGAYAGHLFDQMNEKGWLDQYGRPNEKMPADQRELWEHNKSQFEASGKLVKDDADLALVNEIKTLRATMSGMIKEYQKETPGSPEFERKLEEVRKIGDKIDALELQRSTGGVSIDTAALDRDLRAGPHYVSTGSMSSMVPAGTVRTRSTKATSVGIERARSELIRVLQDPNSTEEQRTRAAEGISRANALSAERVREETGVPATTSTVSSGGVEESVVRKRNKGATRNQDITPELEARVHEAVRAVYGEGARADLYSGGQEEYQPGKKQRRTGSTRHDAGKAGDFYIYDAEGNQIKGDALGNIAQYWLAKGYGSVGLEMKGGGIHLDEHTDRATAWGYADKGGQYSKAQREAVRLGKSGQLPELKMDPSLAALPGQSIDSTTGKASSSKASGKTLSGQKGMMMNIYESFLSAGFSEGQARALTAEVGRENDFRSDLIFGSHTDPKNKLTNVGMISMQKDRRTALLKHLESKGLVDKSGNIVQSQEALNAQAEFIRKEMESGTYKVSGFLENKDIGSEEAAKILGKNYVKWAYDDPKYASHHAKRRKYYNEIAELSGGGYAGAAIEPSESTASSRVSTAASESMERMGYDDVISQPSSRGSDSYSSGFYRPGSRNPRAMLMRGARTGASSSPLGGLFDTAGRIGGIAHGLRSRDPMSMLGAIDEIGGMVRGLAAPRISSGAVSDRIAQVQSMEHKANTKPIVIPSPTTAQSKQSGRGETFTNSFPSRNMEPTYLKYLQTLVGIVA